MHYVNSCGPKRPGHPPVLLGRVLSGCKAAVGASCGRPPSAASAKSPSCGVLSPAPQAWDGT